MSVKLYTIMPCYNEQEILRQSAETVLKVYDELIRSGEISEDSRILFVDDGSEDETWKVVTDLNRKDGIFQGIRLSRNKGHQTALYAGMMASIERGADCVVTIDADLQQDIHSLPLFLEKYKSGCDVVYGIRDSRKTDGLGKRITATVYYKMMRLLGCDLIEQSADYRLMSARAVDSLMKYKESNLFIRGLVPTIGFRSDSVYFHVKEREAGQSKYTLKKMIGLAMDGITSFSIKPVRIITILGFVTFLVSIAMMIITIIDYLKANTVPGWSTITVSIWFLGGVQLLSLGIIGEYVGRTYMESKNRPRYFIDEQTD